MRTDRLTSSDFGFIKFSADVGTMAGGVSNIWMQLYVNEIVQHKLALTSGVFVSLLFFLAPHGICRRRKEKPPGDIVGNQRKEQSVRPCQGAARLQTKMYEVGTWMPCGKPRCITPDIDSMSEVKNKRIYMAMEMGSKFFW